MSEVIENRVVQMAFDNTKFEKGVRATLNLLDRLNSAIAGLNGIKYNVIGFADAVKSVTFDPINQQMQIGVGKAMALTAALTGVYNISNQIYNTITSTFRSLTFDQIGNGYARYEQMVNSTQVILNATKKAGESEEQAMERVTALQERLLWFADETSYDAMTMLDTAGKFLNRGFDFDQVATAMEGIANWGATAAVNANGVIVAMQQLAQAMGSPYIRQQDWMSITGLNMDTKQFKELVIQSALAHKTIKKVGNEFQTLDGKMTITTNDMEKSFSKGWFTTEVLMDVLEQYGKATDLIREKQEEMGAGTTVTQAIAKLKEEGVAEEYQLSLQAFEMGQVARTFTDAIGSIQTAAATKFAGLFKIFIGDYLEAKELWTGVSEELYKLFIDPLNVLLDGFNRWNTKFKGSKRFWESVIELWETCRDVLEQIHKTMFKAFGIEATEEMDLYDKLVYKLNNSLVDLLKKFEKAVSSIKHFNDRLKENETVWNHIENFFKGIKVFIDLIADGFTKFRNKLLYPLLARLEPTIAKFSVLGTDFYKFAEDIKSAADKSDFFNTIFGETYKVLDKVITKVEELFDVFQNTFDKLRDKSIKSENGEGFFTSMVKDADETKDSLDELVEFIAWALDEIGLAMKTFTPIAGAFAEVLKAIAVSLGDVFLSLLPLVTAISDVIVKALQTLSQSISGNEESQEILRRLITTFNYGVANLLDRIHNGNLDSFERFLKILQDNYLFYKTEMFGGKNVFEVMVQLIGKLLSFKGAALIGLLMVAHVIAQIITFVKELVEDIQLIFAKKWNGVIGHMLFGETFENVTSQWFYKALAQTISAIADTILSLAAALLIISLIPPDRLDASVKVLDHMVIAFTIMMLLIETIMIISSRITVKATTLMQGPGKKEGLLSRIGSFIFGTDTAGFMETAKYTGLATVISAISNAFIKISIALILISSVANGGKLKESTEAMIAIGSTIAVMTSVMLAILALADKLEKKSAIDLATGTNSTLARQLIGASILIAFVGKSMLTMAKALRTVASAMKEIGPEQDIWTAVYVIGSLMTLVMVFFAEVSLLGRGVETFEKQAGSKIYKKTTRTAADFLTMARLVGVLALSVSVMIGAVMLLGHMVEKGQDVKSLIHDLGIILVALIGLIASMIGLAYAANKIDPARFAILTNIIAALSLPILALAAVVGVMSLVDVNKLDEMKYVIFNAFASLAAMVWASSTTDPAKVMAMAGAMTLIMLGFLAFVPLIAALAKYKDDAEEVEKLFGILTGIVAAVGAIIAIISGIFGKEYGAFFLAGAGFFDMLCGGFLLLGAAIYLFGASIDKTANALLKFAQFIWTLQEVDGDKIANNLKKTAKGIPDFLQSIGKGLALGMSELNNNGILFNFIGSIFGAIIGAIDLYKDSFFKLAVSFLNGWFNAMLEVQPQSNKFWKIILTGFFEILMDVLDVFVPRFILMASEAWELILQLADHYLPANVKRLENFGWAVIRLVNNFIVILLGGTAELFEKIHGLINQHIPIIIGLLMETFTNFLTGIMDAIGENSHKIADSFVKMVIDIIEACADAIDDNQDQFVKAVTRLMGVITDTVMQIALTWLDPTGTFYRIGQWAIAGITMGMSSKLSSLKANSHSIGGVVTTTVMKDFDMNSPSKLMQKLGSYVTEGFANGLKLNKDTIKQNAITTLTGWRDEVFGIIKENIGWKEGTTLQEALFGFFDIDPSIMPTLDLSNIESGIDDINSMFANNLNLTEFQASLGDITNSMNAKQLSGLVGSDGFNVGDISLGNDSVSLTNAVEDFNSKMDEYITIQKYNMNNQQDVNVYLEGDTKQIFNVVRKENVIRTRATGYNALAMQSR